MPPKGKALSAAAYHQAALQDTERLTNVSTAAEVNRVQDRLLLRAWLSKLAPRDDTQRR